MYLALSLLVIIAFYAGLTIGELTSKNRLPAWTPVAVGIGSYALIRAFVAVFG